MQPCFEHIPFADAGKAAAHLAAILAHERPGLDGLLAAALAECANPDRALTALDRFLERCLSAPAETALMAASPKYLRLLLAVFSQSYFLSDILCRHPEYASWLWSEVDLTRARPSSDMLAELLRDESVLDSFDGCLLAMRRFRQREILRIAARDIFMHAPVASVTEDLSNLADTMLEAALRAADHELTGRFGVPMAASEQHGAQRADFVIMAMGKLGGRELNFSSDIDLLFLYSDEGETTGGRSGPIGNEAYFKKLGERVIRALSEQTAEGLIFRVDMRLRPYGSIGALAVTLDYAVHYYLDCGRAWERQAMIKARPCAGHLPLGELFLERLRPFVFPKYFDDATLEDIRETKRRTEVMIAEAGESEREVKLGRGGIRDIEFTVQMLQLLNGGRWPDLRTANTLRAIDILGRHQCIRPFDATTLASNYVFLRQVEHRLQIEDGRQCHALPEDANALDEFARRLGYQDGASFMNVYRERAQETRGVLEQFLATKGAGHLWVGDLLNPHSGGEAGMARLRDFGFQDPQRARQELLQLATGTDRRPFRRHVHQQFSAITPFLLNAMSFTAHPDAILMRLGQILDGLSAPATLYELLAANPVLCHFLVTLVANSEYLCAMLIRDPGLLDLMSSVEALDVASTRERLEAELDSLKNAVEPDAALFRLRDGETLRIAMRDLVRNITVPQVGDELTQLAEVILAEALRQGRAKVVERLGPCDAPFAILGLGKLGGREMGYGADLDLIFVYDAEAAAANPAAAAYFAEVAAQTIRILREPTRYGLLYQIDARLRPDGSKGVLAIEPQQLEEYYCARAQAWERFALMKARAVAGDAAFAARIEGLARDIAFATPLNRDTMAHVDLLRSKMVAQAEPGDIKKREGGLAELEYAVRCRQLMHARRYPELKRGGVFGALDILQARGGMTPNDCEAMRRAYADLRRILNRLRMMQGSQTSVLPATPEAQAEFAARLGIKEELTGLVDAHCARVHAIYETIRAEVMNDVTAPPDNA